MCAVDKTIENLADKFIGLAKEKGQKSSFPWAIILWALGLLVVGLMFYLSFQKNRELAKLVHENNVRQEKIKQAEADKKIAANDAAAKKLQTEIYALELDIATRNKTIHALRAESEKVEEKLANVKDWKTINTAFGDK